MIFKATLTNRAHQEYGVVSIPFPIPDSEYDHTIELLEAIGIGDAQSQDCRVDKISSSYPVLNRLVTQSVNLDELDYLAKRLDSFCEDEERQFSAMAHKLCLSDIKDFINLTFCCQQATVIADFSDLDRAGRDHSLAVNGGSMLLEELHKVDGQSVALELILNGSGMVTPYGVVYDNGMKLRQVYDGRHLPEYYYHPCPVSAALSLPGQNGCEMLYFPCPNSKIARALQRLGAADISQCDVDLRVNEFCDTVSRLFEDKFKLNEHLDALNRMARCYQNFQTGDAEKLFTVLNYACPQMPEEAARLAEDLRDFTVANDSHTDAYISKGYAKRRESLPVLEADGSYTVRLTLRTSRGDFPLGLPAAEAQLDLAKEVLGIEDFAQVSISGVQFSNPALAGLVPTDLISVEEANELAEWIQQMEQEEGALMKYCAALEVEQPHTFSQALTIATDADDYELVPEDMGEYGRQVLQRIGADDELLDTIDGYMDFAQLGRDSMAEDGVRRTAFGLVRRLSFPFPQQEQAGPSMC